MIGLLATLVQRDKKVIIIKTNHTELKNLFRELNLDQIIQIRSL